jgi:dihydrofolate synthase / folylpolyglutamate synthase
MNFNEALAYLLSLGHETLTIKLGLKNTEVLLEALKNPHESFPAVQIAGTNGKGSTAVMLDSICRAARIRTGRFTSPHLISITERITIDGQEISPGDFARLTNQVRETALALIEQHRLETWPTFFEQLTAISLLAFREAKVDLAVLETGLGGRLDSTTAAKAAIVAITPIAIDHEEYLGKTIAEIAVEKAAIIRAGVTAVVGPQLHDALDVILRRCAKMRVTPQLVSKSGHVISATTDGRCRVTFETPRTIYDQVQLGLRGRHQVDNAAIAVALAESLSDRGFEIAPEAIIQGLKSANHPGRLELWEGAPPLLFDGAHNPASAQALREYLDEFIHQPIMMIFGAMRDKRLGEMAAILFPKADQLILTQPDNPRAASAEELAAAVPAEFDPAKVRQTRSIQAALGLARELATKDHLVLITGSLYLIGAAQEAARTIITGES